VGGWGGRKILLDKRNKLFYSANECWNNEIEVWNSGTEEWNSHKEITKEIGGKIGTRNIC